MTQHSKLLLVLNHLLSASALLGRELLAAEDISPPPSAPTTETPPPEAPPAAAEEPKAEAEAPLPKYKRPVSEGTQTAAIRELLVELLRSTPGLRLRDIQAALKDKGYSPMSLRNAVWRLTQAGDFTSVNAGTNTRYYNKGATSVLAPAEPPEVKRKRRRSPSTRSTSFREDNVARMTTPGTTIHKAREDILQELREHPGEAKGRMPLAKAAALHYGGDTAPSLSTYKMAITLMREVGDIELAGDAYRLVVPRSEPAPSPPPEAEVPVPSEVPPSAPPAEPEPSKEEQVEFEPAPVVEKVVYVPPPKKTPEETAAGVIMQMLTDRPNQTYNELFQALTRTHKFSQPIVHKVFSALRGQGKLQTTVQGGKTVYYTNKK